MRAGANCDSGSLATMLVAEAEVEAEVEAEAGAGVPR